MSSSGNFTLPNCSACYVAMLDSSNTHYRDRSRISICSPIILLSGQVLPLQYHFRVSPTVWLTFPLPYSALLYFVCRINKSSFYSYRDGISLPFILSQYIEWLICMLQETTPVQAVSESRGSPSYVLTVSTLTILMTVLAWTCPVAQYRSPALFFISDAWGCYVCSLEEFLPGWNWPGIIISGLSKIPKWVWVSLCQLTGATMVRL